MKIGNRYTKDRVIKRDGNEYEELNAFVEGHAFEIQSAMIGKPLRDEPKSSIHGILIYAAACALAVGAFVMSVA